MALLTSPLTATPYPSATNNAITDLLQVPGAVLNLEQYANLRFATQAARDAAIATPLAGMAAYITSEDNWYYYNGTIWATFVGGTWTAYTPTLTNLTLGTGGTIVARWKRIDPTTAKVHVALTLGSAAFAVSTAPDFTLPSQVPIGLSYAVADCLGVALLNDTSAGASGRFSGACYLVTGASNGRIGFGTSGGAVTATVPMAWAAGDKLSAELTYETTAG